MLEDDQGMLLQPCDPRLPQMMVQAIGVPKELLVKLRVRLLFLLAKWGYLVL